MGPPRLRYECLKTAPGPKRPAICRRPHRPCVLRLSVRYSASRTRCHDVGVWTDDCSDFRKSTVANCTACAALDNLLWLLYAWCPLTRTGAVAQMGERMTGSHEVRGSIPRSSIAC